MENNKSFTLYVVHGGTSFGLTEGANYVNNSYNMELTSYDLNAPITESGKQGKFY